MPQIFASAGIQREQTIGEKICALPVTAIKIVGRRAEWKIGDRALLVYGDFAPRIDSTDASPGILGHVS